VRGRGAHSIEFRLQARNLNYDLFVAASRHPSFSVLGVLLEDRPDSKG
jgi:hypothetical protein